MRDIRVARKLLSGGIVSFAPLATAALLGAASIPHCMGMCGPIAGACTSSRGAGLAYQLSRLFAYTALGGLASRIVSPLREALPHGLGAHLLAAIMAAALLTSAVRLFRSTRPTIAPDVPVSRLARPTKASPILPVALGAVTGLLPCGSLYGALAVAAASDAPAIGAATMLVFGSVSAVGLIVSNAAARVLATDAGARGRRVVASVLVVGAALALLRPLVARDDAAPCHDDASHLATMRIPGGHDR